MATVALKQQMFGILPLFTSMCINTCMCNLKKNGFYACRNPYIHFDFDIELILDVK